MKKKPEKKRLITKIGVISSLILGSIIFSLLVCEFVVRILPKNVTKIEFGIKDDNRIFSYNRTYEYKPDSERNWTSLGSLTLWHFNNYGFRERGVQDKKVEGNVYRTLFVGDSMTMGLGVEDYEAYPRQLEKILNAKGVGNSTIFENLNFALWSEGPIQYYETAKEFVPRLKPNLLIVGYFIGNDAFDDVYYTKSAKFRFWQALPDRIFPYSFNEFLKNNSYLYQLVLTKYYTQVAKLDPNMTDGEKTKEQGYLLNKQALLDIKKLADKNSVKLLVLGLPTDLEIIQGKKEVYTERMNEIGNWAQQNNINYLDFYNYFMQAPKRTSLMIKGDTHLTPEGHQLVAKVLSDYLVKNNLIPKD